MTYFSAVTANYSAELIEAIADAYAVRRSTGELNRVILVDLAKQFDRSIGSLRAKLQAIFTDEDKTSEVYIKDTDAEKSAIEADKKATTSVKRATKKEVAAEIALLLGITIDPEDLAKAKVDTLTALHTAVSTLIEAQFDATSED